MRTEHLQDFRDWATVAPIAGETGLRLYKIRLIQEVVCRYFNVTLHEMLMRRRTTNLVLARQVAMYLTYSMTHHSMLEVGRRFRRDHTTVLHAFRKIERLANQDEVLALRIGVIALQIEKFPRMSAELLQRLYDAMAANRQPCDRQEKYAFPRGWNECLDFIERTIKGIVGEKQ